ncbi:hypothetical protein D3C80_965930 [compost metagenome]
MGQDGVVGLRIREGLEGRHVYGVGVRTIEGGVAAGPDIGAGRGEVALRVIDPLGDGGPNQRRIAVVQPLDLIQVEDRVALEEAPAAPRLRVFGLFIAGLYGRGVDDGSASFALADRPAERNGLTKGHPDGTGVPAAGGSSPEGQDVDPVIGLAVMS